jgi:hypothetical protein
MFFIEELCPRQWKLNCPIRLRNFYDALCGVGRSGRQHDTQLCTEISQLSADLADEILMRLVQGDVVSQELEILGCHHLRVLSGSLGASYLQMLGSDRKDEDTKC